MKRKWRPLIALVVCSVIFAGYLIYSRAGVDSRPPTITIAQDSEAVAGFSMAELGDALLRDVTAFDDTDADVTDSLIVEQIGNIGADDRVQVVYAAFDSKGNVAKLRRTVRITDYSGPRFTLTQPLNFICGTAFDPIRFISAEDPLDGEITHRIKATLLGEAAINTEGIHDVQFRVTNSLGDTVSLVLPVEVSYSGRYLAELTLSEYLIYLPVGAAFAPEDYLSVFTLYGSETDLSGGIPAGYSLSVDSQVSTDVPGVYSVRYTVSTGIGNQTQQGYTRLIVVVEG